MLLSNWWFYLICHFSNWFTVLNLSFVCWLLHRVFFLFTCWQWRGNIFIRGLVTGWLIFRVGTSKFLYSLQLLAYKLLKFKYVCYLVRFLWFGRNFVELVSTYAFRTGTGSSPSEPEVHITPAFLRKFNST